jgi:hypothetical protein
MAYTHEVDSELLDANIEDFAIMIKYRIAPAGQSASGLPSISDCYFAIWSKRADDPDDRIGKRGLSTPNGAEEDKRQIHSLTLNADTDRKLEMSGCQLLQRVKCQSPAERQSLCLWSSNQVTPGAWSGDQPELGIRNDVAQSVEFAQKDLGAPYHIQTQENGLNQCSDIGICRPLLSTTDSFSSILLETVVAGGGIPEIKLKSAKETVSLFPGNRTPVGGVSGYILILAGAFAPSLYNQFNYSWWSELLGGEKKVPNAQKLYHYAQRGHMTRSGLGNAERTRALGIGAPVEILHMTNVENTNTRSVLA